MNVFNDSTFFKRVLSSINTLRLSAAGRVFCTNDVYRGRALQIEQIRRLPPDD